MVNKIRIFINGVLLTSLPSGFEDFYMVIERESGFDNKAQILREKIDTGGLKFTKHGYEILCRIKGSGSCAQNTIKFEYRCRKAWKFFYNGTFQIKNIQIEYDSKTATLDGILDNSFAGRLQDNVDTQVQLYSSRTRNCEVLALIDQPFLFNKNPDGSSEPYTATAFDALQLLQYIVSFHTDNHVTVRSDFLTNNKFGFTKAYNLHNTSGTVDKVFGEQTFSGVFNALRKKKRLYMVLENSGGAPVLRIEQEGYSYDASTELRRYNKIPKGCEESYDEKRIYNSIEVGSNMYKLQDPEEEPAYPQNKLTSWIKENYNSCGGCTQERDAEGVKLLLVSDEIIDSNVIYEALGEAEGNDYNNDDEWVLFEYEVVDGVNTATLTEVDGTYIYNAGLRNEQVITEWLGYTPGCITLKNSTTNYFRAARTAPDFIATGSFIDEDFPFAFRCNKEIIDNADAHIYDDYMSQGLGSYFIAPVPGAYKFSAKFKHTITQFDCLDPNDESQVRIYYEVYDAGATLIDTLYGPWKSFFNNEIGVAIQFTSPVINLNTGEFVKPIMHFILSDLCGGDGSEHRLDDVEFELIADSTDCDQLNDPDNSAKPVIIKFPDELCFEDLENMIENKPGHFLIEGKKFYIDEVRGSLNGSGQFILRGEHSLCVC